MVKLSTVFFTSIATMWSVFSAPFASYGAKPVEVPKYMLPRSMQVALFTAHVKVHQFVHYQNQYSNYLDHLSVHAVHNYRLDSWALWVIHAWMQERYYQTSLDLSRRLTTYSESHICGSALMTHEVCNLLSSSEKGSGPPYPSSLEYFVANNCFHT